MNKALAIIYAVHFVNLLFSARDHGQAKTGKESFWVTSAGSAISLVLLWWALGWRFI